MLSGTTFLCSYQTRSALLKSRSLKLDMLVEIAEDQAHTRSGTHNLRRSMRQREGNRDEDLDGSSRRNCSGGGRPCPPASRGSSSICAQLCASRVQFVQIAQIVRAQTHFYYAFRYGDQDGCSPLWRSVALWWWCWI